MFWCKSLLPCDLGYLSDRSPFFQTKRNPDNKINQKTLVSLVFYGKLIEPEILSIAIQFTCLIFYKETLNPS